MPSNFTDFVDKKGSRLTVGECHGDDLDQLTTMYDLFSPKALTQGLPPVDDLNRRLWVENLVDRGLNFVAFDQKAIIGHAAIIPDGAYKEGEYIIFILDKFRNRGIGSKLTELSVKKAINLKLDFIWLTVESYNFRAIRVYKKVGFEFCDEGELERTMQLDL